MCGRYSLTQSIKTIAEHFGLKAIALELTARFNIAPTQSLPVLVQEGSERALKMMRWGLIPSWAKDESLGNRMINARAETVAEKPSFRASFKNRRCLIPADGFFEWKTEGKVKTPYYIRSPRYELLAFAGLWSEWKGASHPLLTYTIITTEANRTLQPLHHRMPVIVSPDAYDTWLDPATTAPTLQALLKPQEEGLLEYFAVSRTVNSPKNDSADCLQPAD